MAQIVSCLNNVIGIDKQCATVTPTSGLFINDLTSIDLEVGNAVTNSEEWSGVDTIQKIIDYTKEKMVQDFRTLVQPNARVNSVIQNDTVGYYLENLQPIALEAGQYKGIRVQVDESPYMEFYVNSITLQLDAVVATNILVFDLITGLQIGTSIPITTVANTPTEVIVNRTYTTEGQKTHLLFVIDSGLAGTFNSQVYPGGIGSCGTCKNRTQVGNIYATFDGADIDQLLTLIDSNVTSIGNTNGMSINYSLTCSVDNLICNMANMLAWGLLHKSGANLMREVQYSRRLNSIVTIHADDAVALRAEWDQEYVDTMNSVLSNLKLPADICFQCNDRIGKAIQIP